MTNSRRTSRGPAVEKHCTRVLRNVGYLFTIRQDLTSQNARIFRSTAVRTSDLARLVINWITNCCYSLCSDFAFYGQRSKQRMMTYLLHSVRTRNCPAWTAVRTVLNGQNPWFRVRGPPKLLEVHICLLQDDNNKNHYLTHPRARQTRREEWCVHIDWV